MTVTTNISRSVGAPSGFIDLGVSETVVATLARQGIRAPFAIQSLVLADALAGRGARA